MDWGDEAATEAWHSSSDTESDPESASDGSRSPPMKGYEFLSDKDWSRDGCGDTSSEAATEAGGDETDHGEEMAAALSGTAMAFMDPDPQFLRETAAESSGREDFMRLMPAAVKTPVR